MKRLMLILTAVLLCVMFAACEQEKVAGKKEKTPGAEATPTTEAKPTAEPTPTTEAKPTAEPTPTTEAKPTAEPTPTTEVNPTEDPLSGSEELTSSSSVKPQTKPMDEAMVDVYEKFAYSLFRKCSGDGTYMISPWSVYVALCMTANGAEGNTEAQMNEVLGLTMEERNAYLAAWIDKITGSEAVSFTNADSVWINKLFRDSISSKFLGLCADYYQAAVFSAEMDQKTLEDVNAWISKNTKDMIPKMLDNLSPRTALLLINAITLEADWQEAFKNESVRKENFTHADGTVTELDMMYGSADSLLLEDDTVTGIVKSYANPGFRYIALLPNEGKTVADVIAKMQPGYVRGLLENAEPQGVLTALPKYESKYGKDLVSILAELGLSDAVSPALANFRGIYTGDSGNLYIDQVLHKTFIEVDTKGTRAAAATVVDMRLNAAVAQKLIRFDQPFVYMIVDENNLPIFVGTYE